MLPIVTTKIVGTPMALPANCTTNHAATIAPTANQDGSSARVYSRPWNPTSRAATAICRGASAYIEIADTGRDADDPPLEADDDADDGRRDGDDGPTELLAGLAERLEQRADEHQHHLPHRDGSQQLGRHDRRLPLRTEEERDQVGREEDSEHEERIGAGRHGLGGDEEPSPHARLVVLHARERGQRDLVDERAEQPDGQLQQSERQCVEREVGGAEIPADEDVVDVVVDVPQRTRAHQTPRERPQLSYAPPRRTHGRYPGDEQEPDERHEADQDVLDHDRPIARAHHRPRRR